MVDDLDLIKEFLVECEENLGRLDQEIVQLETDPDNPQLVASIFRTIHTIKGTSGFLSFDNLTGLTHEGENLLSQVRDGKRKASTEVIGMVLETVDAIKGILEIVEATGTDGTNSFEDLKKRLHTMCESAASQPGTPPKAKAPALPELAELIEAAEKAGAAVQLAGAPAGSAAAKVNAIPDSSIRVDLALLDRLMNLVGELVLARNQIVQVTARVEGGAFNATGQRLSLITSELQESVMKTRMQPIGIVWSKFPRVVRDLGAECGKYINLTMDGAETELDRTIIEAIKDPLTHLVRNSCDHGIERPDERVRRGKPATGRLGLRAFHEGGYVNIEISDDGAGIDPERVKAKAVQKGILTPEHAARLGEREAIHLIFQPGFSTAEKVSNISGRGVGMDVVKTNIERIGGLVDLSSVLGHGSTIKIKIPLTLAIIPGLTVTVSDQRFVIPQVSLSELIRLEGESGLAQIERIHGLPVFRRRGALLPIAFLSEILKLPTSAERSDVLNIVVLQVEGNEVGLVVDAINDTQEIVVKPLGKLLKSMNIYSGATIMGDGKVALILDVPGIAHRAGIEPTSGKDSARLTVRKAERPSKPSQSLLFFKAGKFERLAVPLSLVARLEEIPCDHIERAGGQMAVQYRGQILPLICLAKELDPQASDSLPESGNVQVVVFTDGDALIGLVVDSILDITQEHVSARRPSRTPGLIGSAIVGRRVTDFVDLQEIVARSGVKFKPPVDLDGPAVLVADRSAFARAHIRGSLEMAGYRVVEAGKLEEAVAHLARDPVRAVVAALNCRDLAEHLKSTPKFAQIPLLGLSEGSAGEIEESGHLYMDLQSKFDTKGMLDSLERLAGAVSEAGVKTERRPVKADA